MLIKTITLFIMVSLIPSTHLYTRPSDMRFEQLSYKHGLAQGSVGAILQDSRGFMWFGTRGGLNRYDGYKFEVYKNDPNDPYSLSSNSVYTLYEDHPGILWIGTSNGLNKFGHRTERFTLYIHDPNNPNRLSDNDVRTIHEDPTGFLWLGTSSGELFFGGGNGLNAFYPEEVVDSTFIPPVVLTDFKLFNKSVPIGRKDSPLKQHINETEHIILSHRQSVFSFEFAALNYRSPKKNQYAYKMENPEPQVKETLELLEKEVRGKQV